LSADRDPHSQVGAADKLGQRVRAGSETHEGPENVFAPRACLQQGR
jgi:hypothetical protein